MSNVLSAGFFVLVKLWHARCAVDVEKKENTNERRRSSYHDEYATVEREEAVERKDKYAVRFMNPSTTINNFQLLNQSFRS